MPNEKYNDIEGGKKKILRILANLPKYFPKYLFSLTIWHFRLEIKISFILAQFLRNFFKFLNNSVLCDLPIWQS